MIVKISKTEFIGPFNMRKTLESDQCPSDIWSSEYNKYKAFIKIGNSWHSVWIWEDARNLFVKTQSNVSKRIRERILYHFWHDYNLPEFYRKYRRDKYISKIIGFCKGLRVMRDLDINYRIIEAILTQNSSVKQIRNMESRLRKYYGNDYSFDLKKIAKASEKELQQKCRVGYRAKYLINVAKKILSGELDIEEISKMDSKSGRRLLVEIDGIGPKVADIILLYGFGKPDVFPMDVWLRKALIREYFNNEKVPDKKLREFALNCFGRHAGIAHLYMFYYERKLRRLGTFSSLRSSNPCGATNSKYAGNLHSV